MYYEIKKVFNKSMQYSLSMGHYSIWSPNKINEVFGNLKEFKKYMKQNKAFYYFMKL